MDVSKVSDDQWLVLDLLAAARRVGRTHVLRQEILESSKLPGQVKIRLVMAALLMDAELMAISNTHEFHITEKGLAALALKHGTTASEVLSMPRGIAFEDVVDVPPPGAKPN